MADSYVLYTGDGAQTNWSVTFPYIDQDHVHFYVDGVERTTGLSWPSSGVITASPAVANLSAIKIARETPTTALVNFQNRNNLTEENLRNATLQALYLSVEAQDRANDSIVPDNTGKYDFNNRRAFNLADPVDDQDAVTKAWAETSMDSELALAITARNAAQTAQTAAVAAQTATEAVYDSFDDRYLGAKAADPTLDNDGNALVTGALYFNSVSGVMRVRSGGSWADVEAGVTSFNGRQGAVVPASGDYAIGNITGAAAIAASGSATDLTTGAVPAARMPAHTGDVTSTLGSIALTIAAGVVTFAKLASAAVATAAEYMSNTASKLLSAATIWSAAAEVTLTDAATIAVDMNTFINATVTLAGNRALGNPTNEKPGQSGTIRIVQDGTGSRTLSYGTDWEFANGTAPVLSTTAAKEDLLFYYVIANNRIFASLQKASA